MKIKSETIAILLFILFAILVFATALTRNEIFNQIFALLIFVIPALIILIYFAYILIKNPKNIIEKLKKQSIIIKILIVITVICLIYDLYTGNTDISGFPILLLIITLFCEWFFKKEENNGEI